MKYLIIIFIGLLLTGCTKESKDPVTQNAITATVDFSFESDESLVEFYLQTSNDGGHTWEDAAYIAPVMNKTDYTVDVKLENVTNSTLYQIKGLSPSGVYYSDIRKLIY